MSRFKINTLTADIMGTHMFSDNGGDQRNTKPNQTKFTSKKELTECNY